MITNKKKQEAGINEGNIYAGFQKRAIVFLLLCINTSLYAAPLPLHVDGNKIKDANEHVVVLRGVSAPDIGMIKEWYGITDYIDRLTNEDDPNGNSPGWYTKVISYAVCPNDSHVTDSPLVFNPYDEDDPNNEAVYDALKEAVDYGAEKGIYSIIKLEYHENVADKVAETSAFWSYMAPRFAGDGNVLFELFSEPTDSAGSWGVVRDYMQSWVDIVRASGADNLVLVTGPCWAQQIGPAVLNDNPIDDDNTVYVVHFYGLTWRTNQAWITEQINAVAPVYPVMVTAWGYEPNNNDPNNPNEWAIGSASDFGEPVLDYLEGLGIGSVASSASHNWHCYMFDPNWQLLCDDYMGCFVKDWLYEKRDAERSATLAITKCKVAAGKVQGADSFDASGTFPSASIDLDDVTQIDVNIISLTDDTSIYYETLDIDASTNVSNGVLKYSYKIPKGGPGAITSLKIDTNKRTLAIKTKNIDLTGLACPLQIDLTLGYYILSGEVNETILNGKKTIPTRLMRTYQDTLIVTKAKATDKSTPLADSFTVKGDIAVEDTDVNLVNEDVVITWSDANEIDVQTFTIPAGSFIADKTGYVFKCSKITPDEGQGQVAAKIDLYKSLFTLTMKGVDLDTTTGDIKFGLSFADFNETGDYTLP